VALGLGALIAALLSSPAVIRGQWLAARLGRQLAELERKLSAQEQRNKELAAQLANTAPPPEAEAAKPYVGLRTLLTGGESTKPPSP
jgi:primosomal protein N''